MIEILELHVLEDQRAALVCISEDGSPEYALHVGGIPLEGDAQAHLEGRFDELWRVAQRKGVPFDVVEAVREREILRRLLKVLLREINILREAAGLEPRTLAQLKQALRDAD
jgi:hypothetical protein